MLGNGQPQGNSAGRDLVLVSGYYGFDNLGDEAILETLIDELKKLVAPDQIVILSNNPKKTAKVYGVKSVNRWQLQEMALLLPKVKLFVSGGGGLFQDTVSVRSPIFYGGQILLAKLLGAKAMIFAQGIGPLNSALGKIIAKQAYKACDEVTVRDADSYKQLQAWRIDGKLTADPVWTLAPKPLPKELAGWGKKPSKGLRVALSLRESANFTGANVRELAQALAGALPKDAVVIPLPLQLSQDFQILEKFETVWKGMGRECEWLDLSAIEKPSQWITLLRGFDLVIAMRLHCAIMALKSAVPTVPIAYDPKVSHIAAEFDLPTLNLTKDGRPSESTEIWTSAIKRGVENRKALSAQITPKVEAAKNMACQNFATISKILDMQSDRD